MDEGSLPRYTWRDEYAELRVRLDELGRMLGGTYRVLVDETDHVDRAGAVRAGIAFYGKNTMAITHRHGSWVVLGAVISDVEVESSPPLDLDCGECTLCIDACPTGALDEPGVLDATKCLSYWTQAPAAIPDAVSRGAWEEWSTAVTSVRRCVPWNRGVEKRRRGADTEGARSTVSLREWLERTIWISWPRSIGSTFLRTMLAGSAAMLCWRPGTSAARRSRRPSLATSDGPDSMLSDAAAWALDADRRARHG